MSTYDLIVRGGCSLQWQGQLDSPHFAHLCRRHSSKVTVHGKETRAHIRQSNAGAGAPWTIGITWILNHDLQRRLCH